MDLDHMFYYGSFGTGPRVTSYWLIAHLPSFTNPATLPRVSVVVAKLSWLTLGHTWLTDLLAWSNRQI